MLTKSELDLLIRESIKDVLREQYRDSGKPENYSLIKKLESDKHLNATFNSLKNFEGWFDRLHGRSLGASAREVARKKSTFSLPQFIRTLNTNGYQTAERGSFYMHNVFMFSIGLFDSRLNKIRDDLVELEKEGVLKYTFKIRFDHEIVFDGHWSDFKKIMTGPRTKRFWFFQRLNMKINKAHREAENHYDFTEDSLVENIFLLPTFYETDPVPDR